MTLKEAMTARHTVRKYKNKPLPEDIKKQLEERIRENNQAYDLNIRLVTENTEALPKVIGMLMAKGVNNYMILAGPDIPEVEEKLGYSSADLMLYAQTLGLNTWWVGGMFSRKGAKKNSDAAEDAKIIGVVIVGYGEDQGSPHKSKSKEEISVYDGTVPDWFEAGVEAALLAPTAMNRQAFRIKGKKNRVRMGYANGAFSDADLGICKYHFELGAGKENFKWI